MTSARRRPFPGHKLEKLQIAWEARCECGWHSTTWYGAGSRANALGEFRGHIRNCEEARAEGRL